jgi:hypothetical protein
MEDYVSDILRDVSDPSYYSRARAELMSHLSEEYQLLIERGYETEEARVKVIGVWATSTAFGRSTRQLVCM